MTEETGQIRESIGALRASVENLTKIWAEQDRKANEGRRDLYDKFDELKDRFTALEGRVAQGLRDIADMQPAVDRMEVARHRAAGARGLIKYVWTAIVTGVAAVAYVVHDLILALWPPKGH